MTTMAKMATEGGGEEDEQRGKAVEDEEGEKKKKKEEEEEEGQESREEVEGASLSLRQQEKEEEQVQEKMEKREEKEGKGRDGGGGVGAKKETGEEDLVKRTLREYLGYEAFREGQERAVRSILDRRDVLVIMPTGGGKSLTYVLPGLLLPGLILVVSPLLALMQDQVRRLKERGIPAVALNSLLSSSQREALIHSLITQSYPPIASSSSSSPPSFSSSSLPPSSTSSSSLSRRPGLSFSSSSLSVSSTSFKFLFVTPEQIATWRFQQVLRSLEERRRKRNEERREAGEQEGVGLIAIDEAHCISTWGHDFRKSYRKLSILRSLLPKTPLLACTATATSAVCEDIRSSLQLRPNAVSVALSFDRKNIFYEVRLKGSSSAASPPSASSDTHIQGQEEDEVIDSSSSCPPMRGRGDDDEEDEEAWIMNDMCVEILKHHRGETGIIYCFKKVTCDEVAALLRRRGIKAQAYHAGLSDKHRQTLQSAWIEGSIQILVATVAFGLGVDNPKVRFVFHHTLPKTLEGYYQESGRCGRDGLPAHAILYYSLKDYERLRYITDQTFSEAKLYMSKKGKKSLGKNGKKKARTSLAQAPHDSKKEEQEEGEGRAMKRGETNEENEEEEEKETHLHFLEQQYKRDVSALRTMRRFCESHACRRRYILNYFGEEVREDKKEKRDRERDSLECKKDEKDRLGQDRETTEREELSPLIKREKKCEEDEKQDGLNKREKPRPSIKSEDPKAQRCPQNLGAEGGVRKDQMKEENKQPDEDMASLKENNEEISSSSPLENQKMKSLASHSSSSSYRCCDICEREKMPERGLQFRGGRRERTATDGCAALLRHHAVGFYRTSVLSQDSLSMKKRHFRKGGGLTAVVDEDEGGVLVSGTLEIEKNDLGRLSSSPPSSSSEEDEEESSRLKRKRRGSSYGDSFMFERKKNSFSSSFLQGQRNLSHLASKRESKVVYHATPTMTSTVRYGGTGGVSSSSLSRALDGTEERRKEKGSEGEKNASQSIGKRLIAPQGGGESRRERGISDAIRAQGLSAVMRELERQEQEAEEREKEESSSSSAFFKKNRLYGLKQKFFGGAAASSSISSGTKERESSSSFYSLNEKRKAFPLQSNARKKEEGGGGGLSKERRLGLVKEERNSFRSSRDMSKEHQSGNSLSCGPSSSLFKTATRMPSSHGLSKTALLSSLPATKDERSSGNKQENGGFVRVRKGVGLQKKK